MKTRTRPAAVAGRFYPADPASLRQMIQSFLATAPCQGADPKAVIAPHAGYVYSGPIAASAYAAWAGSRDTIRRVVLVGPAHFVPFRGLALPSTDAFETPLGLVPVDQAAIQRLLTLPRVQLLDEAHANEHSLEVQLPFLQIVLDRFSIVPILAGQAADADVAAVLEALWGGPETRFVISSDLSHYLDSSTARRVDRATAKAIETLHPEAIGEEQACGRIPIRGMLSAAREHHLRVQTLDLRNSGDTAGSPTRVVGYGAFAFVPTTA
jgi:hypothetical protein